MRDFASDNYAGICPEAFSALIEANQGAEPAYGEDRYTQKAADKMRELFEHDCDVYFVFNGTAANSLALASLCQSYHSVICHEFAHVSTDECGGPEFFSNGSKLLPLGGPLGKLNPSGVRAILESRSDIHFPKPRVLTLTQPTEVGTVYSTDETGALCALAHERGLKVHVDGARFCHAVASLGVSPAEASWKAGVDVLTFGGTKMGLPVGEAVVFFDRAQSEDFAWRCKQAGQLASKMRYLAAPWLGMLSNNVWLERARDANRMATRLSLGLSNLPGIECAFPTQANGVFLDMQPKIAEGLREAGWHFYSFLAGCNARFMCSWATQAEQVDALIDDATRIHNRLGETPRGLA